MICSNCSQPILDGSKFCTECGSAVGSIASQPATPNPQNLHPDVKKQEFLASVLPGLIVGLVVGVLLLTLGIYLLSRDNSKATADRSSVATRSESTPQPAIATTSVPNTADDTYTAYLTCGMNGFENINILACFTNEYGSTTLEIHNGAAYGLYKVNELSSVGTDTAQGFAIKLQHNFALNMQNASNILKLGVRIYNNRTGQQVFVKQVGEYGVIEVSN